MAMIIALSITLVSVAYLSWMLVRKVELVRNGSVVFDDNKIDEHAILEPRLKEAAKHASLFSLYAKRRFYQYVHVALERFTPWFHVVTLGIVRRLERLTKLVEGKGYSDAAPAGKASAFLQDIAQHKSQHGKGKDVLRGMNLL